MQEFPLIALIAAGFTAAWVLGLFTQWLRLSPIVGYLLAGVLIGPHSPGFVGDLHLAHQLAEVGVILLMFGVGLHFHLEDLLAVKSVAIPGALGQSLAATLFGILIFSWFGMPPKAGAVLGMAMAVASTVVLMRVLMDADALHSPAGHVAVGWLLVEDVLTVIVLVLLPVLGSGEAAATEQTASWTGPLANVGIALLKLAALVMLVMFAGARIIPWVLMQVARLRSRELFTLTVMVVSVAVAAGAYALFGASMALGAFLAGMMVALSPVSHQAAADALPLRDAFAVLFFVAVGMLFDPMFLVREPLMMLAAMVIILIVKPLIALIIVAALGHSVRTSLTVALGLAQIGEFSFILSDAARKLDLLPESGNSLLVGGAIISITLNPMLFRSIDAIERQLKRYPKVWALLNARAERRVREANAAATDQVSQLDTAAKPLAVVVGFGPVGRTVDKLLRDAGMATVVIDMNMDTILELQRDNQLAIFGDASREAILEQAGVERASHLVLTLPQTTNRSMIVSIARNMNEDLKIFVRARYLSERAELDQAGATGAIFEEGEAAVALARLVLADTGAQRERVEHAVRNIRTRLILDNVSNLRMRTIRNIMIPWTRVRRLPNTATLDEVRQKVGEQRFSRWPVIDSQSGAPIGYLLAKDLIGLQGEGNCWTTLMRPLTSVRADNDVESTLQQMQRDESVVCLVQDGQSPVGIVTIEDILEQVVGRIEDEYPRRSKIVLRDMLVQDDSLLDLSGETSEQAITEMAARIPSHRLPPGVNVAELAIARERELSTNVGGDVAIPHARCPRLEEPLVVFGRSEQGVAFQPHSSEKVRLIFLLVTPAEEPDIQVLLLSRLAGVAGNADVRRRLCEVHTMAEVGDLLVSVTDGEAIPAGQT